MLKVADKPCNKSVTEVVTDTNSQGERDGYGYWYNGWRVNIADLWDDETRRFLKSDSFFFQRKEKEKMFPLKNSFNVLKRKSEQNVTRSIHKERKQEESRSRSRVVNWKHLHDYHHHLLLLMEEEWRRKRGRREECIFTVNWLSHAENQELILVLFFSFLLFFHSVKV